MDTPLLTATISAGTALLVTALGNYFSRRREREADSRRTKIDREIAKHDRLRNEVLKWGTPLLAAIRDLRHRLDNILNKEGCAALSPKCKISPSCSMTFDYQMTSTLFLFAQYFAWTRRLLEGASLELFRSEQERKALLSSFFEATWPLSAWPPRDPLPPGSGRDAQIFALQQRGLGEALLIDANGERRLMTYREFQSQATQMEDWLAPLRTLLLDLAEANDYRWHRLALTHKRLAELESKFSGIMERNLALSKAAEHAVAAVNPAAGTSV